MFDSGLSFIVISVCGAVIAVTLYFIAAIIREIRKKERKFNGGGLKGLFVLAISMVVLAAIGICLYEIPRILFNGYNWTMIWEIGPDSVIKAVIALAVLMPVLYLYFLLSFYFTKPVDSPYFLIIIMSIFSSFGNSLMVFIINEALNRTMGDLSRRAGIETGLYIYFILGFLLYTTAAFFTRKKLINLTNKMIYDRRMKIIDKIFGAPYYKFEAMEEGKTFAALNNDPENVSDFVNMFVSILTGSISMVICFIYLGTLNGYGALLSVAIVILASGLFMLVSQSAGKVFERNRDVQNLFFKNINDMINGFKELYINSRKRREFHDDIRNSCSMYTNTRIEGDYKFVGVTILGDFLYMLVIGVVVFTFPLIFHNIQSTTLRSFVVVYLYMGGIVTMLTSLIPGLVRVIVSWKRINSFMDEVSTLEEEQTPVVNDDPDFSVLLKNVEFHYKSENGETFALGPVNCEFRSGEIVFISGGNGSGKTTLAKLITGLYQPDAGEILVNGEKVDTKTLGGYFTTVYSDFYLFDRLYGIDCQEKNEEIERYLRILKINDKVSVKGGSFSTLKLSTGQRKRLALLISYLEDKPAYFFDEWAADQDPEFRRFFYTTLLPELKARGKAVIAITHDDRYFDEADKHIKMEMGAIVEQEDVIAVNSGAFESA